MDEQTPHIHIDFIPFIHNSKRGLDTKVFLKGALAEQGFKGGTRGMTEWNEWIEAEKQELNKMVQSKEVMERNIHAYDEDMKWQLAEPGALMSAKAYRDKKALPLVEKLREVVKNLTIKCVQLAEQSKKLTAKLDGQQKQISRLTDKVMEQSDLIDRLQEKASGLGRLERHFGSRTVKGVRTGGEGK